MGNIGQLTGLATGREVERGGRGESATYMANVTLPPGSRFLPKATHVALPTSYEQSCTLDGEGLEGYATRSAA